MDYKQQIREYLEQYPELFTDYEKKLILNYTITGQFIPADVREVYDQLGILPNNLNIYDGFFQLLKDNFHLNGRRIIEVGGGVIPCLAKRIEAELDTGKIIVYDPRLSIYEKDTMSLKLVRERFTRSSLLADCNLLIGLMPEDAAELLIDRAIDAQIDFMVALGAGGPHGDGFDFYEDADEWAHGVICATEELVERKEMGKLMVKTMEEFGNPYPIIYNKRG
ncbi:MAG: hypothetical protein IJI22_01630 [Bacilli bacterium]|nr:hypothetical protein [Bacilli bacterium]